MSDLSGGCAALIVIAMIYAVAIAIMSIVLMLIWNAIIPDITGFSEITFWQSVGIAFLCSLLFSGGGSSK